MTSKQVISYVILIILFGASTLVAGDDDEKALYWIIFDDKEIADPISFNPDEHQFEHLTERALARRALRGDINGPSYFDLDVSQNYIDATLVEEMQLRTVSRWFNGISVLAPPDIMEDMEGTNHIRKVKRIHKVSKKSIKKISRAEETGYYLNGYGSSYQQLEQINAIAAHDSGYSGNDVWLLMLDTGYLTEHQAFQPERIVAEWDFIQGDSITHNQEGDHPQQDYHGTVCASVAAGYHENVIYGAAYGASLLLAKTEIYAEEIHVEEDFYVAGLEWGEALGADVVSSSLGYNDWYEYEDMDGNSATTTRAMDLVANLGVVCVTAMGNEGDTPWYYMIAPADADSILAVGAVDSSALLASFSSRGPTYDGRIKPEVVARGVLTFAAYADAPGTYTWGNGTSLSTPLVAGAAALILEAHPEWTPMMVRQALMMTADRSLAPDNEYGFGLIDVVAAMEYDFDVVPGDVTNDGLLNISDAVLVLEWVLTQPDLEPDQFEGADINQDGELNISDIIVIIEWILTL